MSTATARLSALDDPRWRAVVSRDRSADGRFVYAVRTTGVYCRPSCGARRPRPENVAFYATSAAAERAGFRACKRCRPDRPCEDGRGVDRIIALCRRIETAEQTPSLADLARDAGLSPHHLQRIFKAATGVTPKAYAAAHRARRLRVYLEEASASVTDAIYGAGYGSNGRFYEQSNQLLGMTPSRYRGGGAEVQMRFAIGACSLGAILVAATNRGVCAIDLGDQADALARELQDRFPRAELVGDDPAFARWVAAVVGFVEAPRLGLDLPLDIRGTAFQQRVWQAMRGIPVGETVSYAELARRVGCSHGARAVARSCAANPLALAIPCHRVVRTDGAITGYRWGVERKRTLLARERESG